MFPAVALPCLSGNTPNKKNITDEIQFGQDSEFDMAQQPNAAPVTKTTSAHRVVLAAENLASRFLQVELVSEVKLLSLEDQVQLAYMSMLAM